MPLNINTNYLVMVLNSEFVREWLKDALEVLMYQIYSEKPDRNNASSS